VAAEAGRASLNVLGSTADLGQAGPGSGDTPQNVCARRLDEPKCNFNDRTAQRVLKRLMGPKRGARPGRAALPPASGSPPVPAQAEIAARPDAQQAAGSTEARQGDSPAAAAAEGSIDDDVLPDHPIWQNQVLWRAVFML
jgi:hypothetical protein